MLSPTESETVDKATELLLSIPNETTPTLSTVVSVLNWLATAGLNSIPGLLGMIYLDARLHVLGYKKIATKTGVKLSPFYPLMVKSAMELRAHRVLLWKNCKPSQLTPTSHFKNELTALKIGLDSLDIELVDAVLIADKDYNSMRLAGLT